MKTLALLFALLLLALFGYGIVGNFLSGAFSYVDLLIFLGAALVVYSIVRIVGGSLDKKFNKSVANFLSGKSEKLFDNRALLRTFGLLLIVLLPFLLYLLALALFAAIDFGLYCHLDVSNLPRVPVGVLIGLAIVVLGTGIAVIVGFYRLFFPPKKKALGITIDKDEQKRLWNLTGQIAKEIKAEPIHKIIITPDPGIGVYLDGGLLSTMFGGGKRVLEIGLPSLHDLKMAE